MKSTTPLKSLLCLLLVSQLSFSGNLFSQDIDPVSESLIEVQFNRPSESPTYRPGDRLRVFLRSRYDFHVYVFYHQNTKESVLIYPTYATGNAKISAGFPIRVGDGQEPELRIAPDSSGEEVVQVLVTRQPVREFQNLIDYRRTNCPVLSDTEFEMHRRRLYHQAHDPKFSNLVDDQQISLKIENPQDGHSKEDGLLSMP